VSFVTFKSLTSFTAAALTNASSSGEGD